MSWGINKVGTVEAVAAEVAADLRTTPHAVERDFILSQLEGIAAHPGTGVKVEANGHSYHDGNHLTYTTSIKIETVRLAKHPIEQ